VKKVRGLLTPSLMYDEYGRIQGSFIILGNWFREYNVVFINPIEMIYYLKPKVIRASNIVEVIDFPELRRRVRERRDLARLATEGSIIIGSGYVSDVLVDILGVRCKKRYISQWACYCYGVVKRVVRRIRVEDLVEESEVVGVSPELKDIESFLMYSRPRLPGEYYGLIIDRIRHLAVDLSIITSQYVVEEDIEELREMEYGQVRIPILVVRKLTFSVEDIWGKNAQRRLIDVLSEGWMGW